MEVAKKKYTVPCTPVILRQTAIDADAEFKEVVQCKYNEVYPNILVGGESIALDKYVLEEMGITHVVNCAQGRDPEDVNTDARYYKGTKVKLYAIRAKDSIGFRIVPFFEISAAYINRALQNGGKVLVHCQTGMSLSPSIVVAFLMIHDHMDVRDALRLVRSKRVVLPNQGFMQQLCELNQLLMEKQTTDPK